MIIQRLKSLFKAGKEVVPVENDYQDRLKRELESYNDCTNVHDLPQIFHYWSHKYLRPKLERFGITDPEHFFFVYTRKYHERFPDQHVNIVSIGCGNCDMECRLAHALIDAGISSFSIDCIDINKEMLKRGGALAKELGVEKHIHAEVGDFNNWKPARMYDVVLANQCLHHVVELESLFSRIQETLTKGGYFLVSDMIGRNGHQRWPEALAIVEEFWKEMPEKYKFNRLMKRQETQYINHDCSVESFEGIRAQDILPLLNKCFNFELFIPFANLIFVFIDRPFGHNFDANAEWDQGFIDRIHERDEQGLLSGELKPTQMLAVLCNEAVETELVDPRLTPESCIRRSE